jgi:hypothetical protein
MENWNKAIDAVIEGFHKKIGEGIDREFVEGIEPVIRRLEEKRKSNKLDIRDLRDCLLVCKNVLVPAAMKQEVDKIQGIKNLVESVKD